MTLTVEDDFREFVAARWPDLEAVAFLVTLDADVARRATADALAGLHHHWREAVEEGRPGEDARRAVLIAVLAPAARRPGTRPPASQGATASGATSDGASGATSTPSRASDPVDAADAAPWPDPADDTVVGALIATLRDATPVQRAAVAGHAVWAAEPEEVAALAGMPGADVRAEAVALQGPARRGPRPGA